MFMNYEYQVGILSPKQLFNFIYSLNFGFVSKMVLMTDLAFKYGDFSIALSLGWRQDWMWRANGEVSDSLW
jgi:hypothetical protein